MTLLLRGFLAVAVSIATLLTALVIDLLLAPLPMVAQFLIQIPILALIMDELRRAVVKYVTRVHGLTEDDIDGTFFFAAPLAALASTHLMGDISSLLRW